MACLAPQLKWAPYATAHAPSSSSNSRCSALRVHCAVASSAAAVVEDFANGSATQLRLAYAAPAVQRNFESTLASEALLNEEAVVAGAAAEAVALARAAAEAVQEVLQMVQKSNNQTLIRKQKGMDTYLANEILRTEMQLNNPDEYANDLLLEDLESCGIMTAEDELGNDDQYTENIAVKSARQSERRAKRTRAAIKVATTLRASQKTASYSKKKRSKGSSSSMNPLSSLWKMTGRRLLTAKEEVEFSEGIQSSREIYSPALVSPGSSTHSLTAHSSTHTLNG